MALLESSPVVPVFDVLELSLVSNILDHGLGWSVRAVSCWCSWLGFRDDEVHASNRRYQSLRFASHRRSVVSCGASVWQGPNQGLRTAKRLQITQRSVNTE